MSELATIRKWKVLFGLVLLCFSSILICCSVALATDFPQYIAHAGGVVNKQTYTNSLEALNENYDKGFRAFEIDLSWTIDGELVAIHDWTGALTGKFIVLESAGIPTEKEFLQLKMKGGLTQLSFKDVLQWAQEKGDVFIITDVKNENIKALHKINTDFGIFRKHIIPQVYSYQEYAVVEAIGYTDIILTLYRMKINLNEVINFSKKNSPFAVTMPWKIAQSGLAYYLAKNRTKVYAHTVNDMELFNSLRKYGVFGIYTDSISPQ